MRVKSPGRTGSARSRAVAQGVDGGRSRSHSTVRRKPGQINWVLLREEWIVQNLVERPTPYSMADLARAHGIPPQTVRVRAVRENWAGQLEERRGQRGEQVRGMLEPTDVFSELNVRVRQATYARVAQDIAIRRLRELTDAELRMTSLGSIAELLRLGLAEERRAIALPDTFTFDPSGDDEDLTPADLQRMVRRFIEIVDAEETASGQPADARRKARKKEEPVT